ncbi:MAG: hypothetical protein A3J83_01105 [Elusimicrobia bacterium RIFOXYA2_FULL_40_6]|nr:MAG: hypothetical protein A3J83_01105 [Elusimicrobia bacterium RIFOXYA2_FULL_40_6]
MIIYLNGKFIDSKKAHISPFDEGYLFGKGLFETLRSVNGGLPFLNLHIDRLNNSLRFFGIKINESKAAFHSILKHLLKANRLTEAYIRITVSSGADNKPTVLIYVKKLPEIPKKYLTNGISVMISQASRTKGSITSGHKTISYLENITERESALKTGYVNALILDCSGEYAVECASANIFAVKNNAVLTPDLSSFPILPGITRQVVIKLAKELELKTIERKILFIELVDADEVFITGSLNGIIPVNRIGKYKIGKPGKITALIANQYIKKAINLVK